MMFSMVLLLAIVISRQHVSHITWQCGTAIIVYYDNAFLSLTVSYTHLTLPTIYSV